MLLVDYTQIIFTFLPQLKESIGTVFIHQKAISQHQTLFIQTKNIVHPLGMQTGRFAVKLFGAIKQKLKKMAINMQHTKQMEQRALFLLAMIVQSLILKHLKK